MRDRQELIDILEHCMKDDCNGCPNHFSDGRVACEEYMNGLSSSIPAAVIQDVIDLLKEQEAEQSEIGFRSRKESL